MGKISDLQITKMHRTSEMIDTNWIGTALQAQPEISDTIAYAFGAEYPLSFLTQGSGRIGDNYKMISSTEFDWGLMGDYFKTVAVKAKVGSHDKPGIGFSRFQIVLPEKYFALGDLIKFESGVVARVQEDPIQDGSSDFLYTLEINGRDAQEYVLSSDLEPGARVAFAGTAFEEGSEGGSSKSAAPMRLRNTMGISRWQWSMTGSAQTEAMVWKMKTSSGTSNLWQPVQEYQQLQMFNRMLEYQRWYNKGNRQADGTVQMHGKSGRVVRTYDGVINQISKANVRSYTELTEEFLSDMLMDLTIRQKDGENRKLMLFGGAGAKRQFHNAISKSASALNLVDTTFVHKKTGENLGFGSYFTSYKDLLGADVTFVHNRIQDDATLFPKLHPDTLLPVESYNMYFLDFSDYGGEPNISLVAKGAGGVNRSLKTWYTAGGADPMGSASGPGSMLRSHGKDGFDMHMLSETSIKVVNPLSCGILKYSMA